MPDTPVHAGPGAHDDLSALAWVYGELRRSLENAHKALRRYLRESEAAAGSDVDAVDLAVLRSARSQLHQGVGALELVGLPAAAVVLRAGEAAVQRMVARPALVNAAAVDTVERLSFALLDFLGRQLAGKPVSPLMLFPQYRAAQQLAGADRIHPADLWKTDWQWLELPPDASAQPRGADDDARGAMETLVLALMRDPSPGARARMSDLCADLAAGARDGLHGVPAGPGDGARLATFWQLAAAVFEAQSGELLAADLYIKRIASRLLAQLRMSARGRGEISDRLAQDLLFFCSHAQTPGAERPAPRLAAVRRAWRLQERPTADYETPRLGRFDPALISQARKRVATAKDSWSAVAGGDLLRGGGLAEQFALVGDSLQRLFPSGEVLAQSLAAAVAQTVAAGVEPPPALAMEVATSMLYLEASLEDGEFDHPDLATRVKRLARRIDEVRIGADPQPLETWMEELYRRVSDRQTMGSVMQELRASLSEVEKQIDQYFRNPAQREVLIPVPAQLSAMRGVLSVLGLEHASQAVVQMRDEVDALAQTDVDPQRAIQAGTFDHLADNLGALSFLIDMLSVQPALAKALFRFDPATGSLSAVMGQPERVSAFAELEEARAPVVEPAAPPLPQQVAALAAAAAGTEVDDDDLAGRIERLAQQALAADRPELARELDRAQAALSSAGDAAARRAARAGLAAALGAHAPAAPEAAPATVTAADHGPQADEELREIFIEEAREVITAAADALERLADAPDSPDDMTAVRRSFHTLKGSARMVGLPAFGEAAWACEQLYNARLAQAPHMDQPLRLFSAEALGYLGDWVDAIDAGRDDGHDAEAVVRAADALRLHGQRLSIEPPRAPAPAGAAPVLDFEFDLADEAPVATGAALAASLVARVPDLPSAADLELGVGDRATARPELPAEALPAPEVETLELDLSATELLFPSVTEPSPDLAPVPLDLDMAAFEEAIAREDAPTEIMPVGEVVADAPAAAEAQEPAEEPVKVIGSLRIGIPLFNIYLNEADELSRRLGTELAEWSLEHDRHPVPETSAALAHSLAGSSATVGYADLSALARALEHALMRSHAAGRSRADEPELFNEAADEIRRLLHQFAAGFLRPVAPGLMERLAEHERLPAAAVPTAAAQAAALSLAEAASASAPATAPMPLPDTVPQGTGASADAFDDDEDIDAVDAVDAELFPVFAEEADELLPQLQGRLREWLDLPQALEAPSACMRTLHTFKGGARLAGAMRLGEMAHRLETAIEHLASHPQVAATDVEPLLGRADAMASAFEAMRLDRAAAEAEPARAPEPATPRAVAAPIAAAAAAAPAAAAGLPEATGAGPEAAEIDWSRFAAADAVVPVATAERPTASTGAGAAVRVRAALLDRLLNRAGEVSITRARIDAEVRQMQAWLADLTDSLERMRRQLRDIELQAETQISSRIEAAKVAAASFDPLEMDRFTRFQELTRFMAESVNDVATLHRSLQRALQSTEDELAAQSRLTREVQDDLLRTRMVEFESMSDRLYRTVRQAAKDAGKQVRLDIEGGAIEIDRGVLERMTGPFEHLLRNAVAHGIEAPPQRRQAGKDEGGRITIAVAQAGNEVAVEIADNGAGLDLQRIRQRAVERGLVAPEQAVSDGELAQLIFSPGFSTTDSVTELAGRGVGMDVVRAEVNAMGGRIETASRPGQGTRFKLLLPLTTAVTQVVMLRCGELQVAVPSTLIEVVRRLDPAEMERAYVETAIEHDGETLPFFWLGALLEAGHRGDTAGQSQAVVIVRSAAQRVAVHVDEVVGNEEVVVKNVGPQLARLPGLTGVTLLPSGAMALIYNPVALASVYAESARARMREGQAVPGAGAADTGAPAAAARAPMVMVVDDSLTVRRVTQRLLEREGYRVVTAKNGIEALERLAQERPVVLLTDIEMPRMDGFDLVRNVRGDARLADLPVIMITSRIAQKHRDYAAEIGVQHYLGKPYSEDELLDLVARFAGVSAPDILA